MNFFPPILSFNLDIIIEAVYLTFNMVGLVILAKKYCKNRPRTEETISRRCNSLILTPKNGKKNMIVREKILAQDTTTVH